MQQQIELPHLRNGDVDWNTLGNILSANILGEVLCASYVDYKFGNRTRGFQADTDWEFAYEEKGVVVLRKCLKDSPLNVFMGRTVIDVPIEVTAEFLADHETRKQWDKYTIEIKELKRMSETDCIVYMLLEAKQCLVKQQRDFIDFVRMAHRGEKIVRSVMSVSLPEYPPNPKIPRGEIQPGTGFVLEPYEEGGGAKTLISYMAHINLKNLPPIIVNRAMRRQPMSLHRIRTILEGSSVPAPLQDKSDTLSVQTFTDSDLHAAALYSGSYGDTLRPPLHMASHMSDRFEDAIPVGDFLKHSRTGNVFHRSYSMSHEMTNGKSHQHHTDERNWGSKENKNGLEVGKQRGRRRSYSSPLFPKEVDDEETPSKGNGFAANQIETEQVSLNDGEKG